MKKDIFTKSEIFELENQFLKVMGKDRKVY